MVLRKKATDNTAAATTPIAAANTNSTAAATATLTAAKTKTTAPKTNGKAKASSKSKSKKVASTKDIERRAFEIWHAKGCPQGLDVEIWLEAEAELGTL